MSDSTEIGAAAQEICEKCGGVIRISDYPFCPHGPTRLSIHGDDIPGGMVVENGFDTPIRVYSHSEHRRRLAERGCEIGAKWAGPHDQHLINWAAGMDRQTLANATALLTPRPSSKYDAPEYQIDVAIEKTTLDETFRVEVSA